MGGIPEMLGIWGGGENYLNFTLAVLGKTVNMMVGHSLNHHGDKRGYAYNFDDLFKNRCVAAYLYGGEELALKFTENHKGNRSHLFRLCQAVIDCCKPHRDLIASKQVIDIHDWAKSWEGQLCR
jgi:hypothetical protein